MHIGDVSESLERFPELVKTGHVQNHGLRLFAQNRSISDPWEFSRSLYVQAQKPLQIHLQVCSRRFRKFGAISERCKNRPWSKPWAIAQGFAQNRSISDPCEFSRNLYVQAQKPLEIHLQACRRRFRYFDRFPELVKIGHDQNHSFCSKSVDSHGIFTDNPQDR